ncbi:hypothetical protein B0H13DRAFT_1852052 [Mycena leptocephala]|nr:hypothetical protein B0H13DRAFT_1852052 [Mycena leptocephala]
MAARRAVYYQKPHRKQSVLRRHQFSNFPGVLPILTPAIRMSGGSIHISMPILVVNFQYSIHPFDSSGSLSDAITIFIDGPTIGTIALMLDIRADICHRGHSACCDQGPMYLMGLWRPLSGYETMSDLGIDGFRHFLMPSRVLGGAADGSLKDAKDIDFGPDPGESDKEAGPSSGAAQRGKAKGKAKAKGKEKEMSDPEDGAYSGSEDSEESDSEAENKVTNEEIADALPSKTVPQGTSRRPKPKKQKTTHSGTSNSEQPSNTVEPATAAESAARQRSPIWHFFENVTNSNHGRKAQEGDRFYQCFHDETGKVLKITKAMKASINGLTGHLKNFETTEHAAHP